ncbi:MAG: queuosine precursor transporter [Prevotella sp.]|nr:queuosine precursor transporter [Prevotella sp.]
MEQDKKKVSVLFMLFSTLFCVCLITANVLETKQLSFGPVNLTAGIIVFPVSYIINDVVCEVWGYQRTRMLIWLGFAMNFFFVIMGAIADWIPGAPYWHGEEGFHVIFGLAPRIALASFIAFIAGSFINAYVMSKMKLSAKESGSFKKNFSARAIWSTVFGEATDSIIFFPLALGGVIPWEEMPSLMISQVTLKTLYEILVLPITIRVVEYTKKRDDEDVYDEDINYNIFNILKI